jgi:hypothetical protein
VKRTVFISHSSADRIIGEQVCRFLEKNGIPCWIAPRDVTPGQNYGAAILDAIDECRVFVLVLSNQSNKSGQVVREVEHAASTDSIIIPFRIEDVHPSRNLAFYVSAAHWLDASTKPIDQHLGELLSAIKNWEKTVGAPEKEVGAQPSLPSPPPETGKRNILRAIVGTACLLVLLLGVLGYQALRHRNAPDNQSPAVAATKKAPAAPAPTMSAGSPGSAPIIKQVTASSELAPEVHRGELKHYEAKLAFDGDDATAWMANGSGPGQWIMVTFEVPTSITSVSAFGGAADADRYEKNNRVKTLRMISSEGSAEVLDLADKMQAQRFQLRRPVVTEWVKFEILAVYPGTRHDSTLISEIAFNRD